MEQKEVKYRLPPGMTYRGLLEGLVMYLETRRNCLEEELRSCEEYLEKLYEELGKLDASLGR